MRAGPAFGQILEGSAGSHLVFRVSQDRIVFKAAAQADAQLSGLFLDLGKGPLHFDHGRCGFLFACIQSRRQKRQDYVHVSHDTVVAVLEDPGVFVDIYGNDSGSVLYALEVLDGAGDAAGNIEVTI